MPMLISLKDGVVTRAPIGTEDAKLFARSASTYWDDSEETMYERFLAQRSMRWDIESPVDQSET